MDRFKLLIVATATPQAQQIFMKSIYRHFREMIALEPSEYQLLFKRWED
jgi:hypothetical protein